MMRLKGWAFAILVVTLVVFAWHQVFVMTGILWWNAPDPEQQLPPPEPVEWGTINTSWVNLDAWEKTHPVWPAVR